MLVTFADEYFEYHNTKMYGNQMFTFPSYFQTNIQNGVTTVNYEKCNYFVYTFYNQTMMKTFPIVI